MNKLAKFQWLIDRDNGLGIPLTTVSRYVDCNISTLSRVLNGKQDLTKPLYIKICNAVDEIYKDINLIVGAEEDPEDEVY